MNREPRLKIKKINWTCSSCGNEEDVFNLEAGYALDSLKLCITCQREAIKLLEWVVSFSAQPNSKQ